MRVAINRIYEMSGLLYVDLQPYLVDPTTNDMLMVLDEIQGLQAADSLNIDMANFLMEISPVDVD